MSRGKISVYLVKQGVKIEGLGKQRQSVIGRGGKYSESEGHKFRIWSYIGDRLAMLRQRSGIVKTFSLRRFLELT